MFLTNLFEALDQRHAAFCFGRLNPPTIGHGQLLDTVANSAQGGDYFIFTSQTQDAKKNPLDYSTKIKFIKALFPEHAGHVVQDLNLKTIMQVAAWLYAKEYRSVTFVAGGDRLADFKELLTKYNGVEGGPVYYKFDNIQFASSGERDPDSEGIAGVSASAARAAAAAGDFEAFSQATGAGKITKELYDAVRKGMNISDSVSEEGQRGGFPTTPNYKVGDRVLVKGYQGVGTIAYIKHRGDVGVKFGEPSHPRVQTTIDNLRLATSELDEGTFTEDSDPCWTGYKQVGTKKKGSKTVPNCVPVDECSGYIPKNAKEAKDPRWSNALSVDVDIDTPNKNLKAFKL